MSRRIVPTEPTQRRIVDEGPAQPRIDAAAVAAALGAETVGREMPFPSITLAMLRERAAALIAERKPDDRLANDSVDLDPALRATVRRITTELRAEGVTMTPSELASTLLRTAIQWFDADRRRKLESLQCGESPDGGQPT
jgi:hypothetical protein